MTKTCFGLSFIVEFSLQERPEMKSRLSVISSIITIFFVSMLMRQQKVSILGFMKIGVEGLISLKL